MGCAAGVIVGVGLAGEVEESAWWNPVSAWRSLRVVEQNPLLHLFAPEAVGHARAAGGALITVLGAAIGVRAQGKAQGALEESGDRTVLQRLRGVGRQGIGNERRECQRGLKEDDMRT